MRSTIPVHSQLISTLLVGLFVILATNRARSQRSSIPPPAWQQDNPVLESKWAKIAGRHIYELACTECHKWGPDYWPKKKWDEYLKSFPANHKPDVKNTYRDLSGLMTVGRSMPSSRQQADALSQFILDAAPAKELSSDARKKTFKAGLAVGEQAPEFRLTDTEGKVWILSDLKKPVVLIFSRAHW